ncbi:hypothetical protein [Streptomyces olivochromogenes]|uniref:Uncharacterized protein n=1 Tax=Streptomyces olivochromogenes TaxID=1963 RepID=A0A250VST5_STROL|nr:hypothetical protein [Streptomyces olivochromogenes]KUN38281.1 hypothetical protein AQJ27_45095 [Streptomyces olivochromogenes]GAX57273.1 hypothetical protein SO3561_08843 [Streptomyces olivochromogenes]
MTDYRESQVDAQLDEYFAKRQAARAARVRAFLDSLTARERALFRDAAVMGYVRGTMHPRDAEVPLNQAIVDDVVHACFVYPDLYPAVATIERCPGFPEKCPNLRVVPADPPTHDGGVRCGCADDPEDESEGGRA